MQSITKSQYDASSLVKTKSVFCNSVDVNLEYVVVIDLLLVVNESFTTWQ
ncbi:MAG: hypothetical protein LBJ00_07735 [Planctomycetaceae bacterium]|nr:hypothetical protein [Planctomycetaceae bacterium]